MTSVPQHVRWSIMWWLVAVLAGVTETVIHLVWGGDDDIVAQVLIRAVVYGLVTALILQLRFGRNWARVALTVLLGGVGLISLLAEPVSWLVAGGSPGEFLSGADAFTLSVVVVRVVHVAAVLAGLVLMYTAAANAFFRAGPEARPA